MRGPVFSPTLLAWVTDVSVDTLSIEDLRCRLVDAYATINELRSELVQFRAMNCTVLGAEPSADSLLWVENRNLKERALKAEEEFNRLAGIVNTLEEQNQSLTEELAQTRARTASPARDLGPLDVICTGCGAFTQERCFGPDGDHLPRAHWVRYMRLEEFRRLRATGML